MSKLQNLEFLAGTINKDGMVNATALTTAYRNAIGIRKDTQKWLSTIEAKDSIAYLERATQNSVAQLVIVENGVGTWLHPDLAEILAQWISVEYRFAVVKLIRDTKASQTTEQPILRLLPQVKELKEDVSDTKCFLSLFGSVDEDRREILAANWVAKKHPEFKELATLAIAALPAREAKEQSFTVTEIGHRLVPVLSPIAVNKKLEALGYQESYLTANGKKKWRTTKKGEIHATLELVAKADGMPSEQLRWKESILHELAILAVR